MHLSSRLNLLALVVVLGGCAGEADWTYRENPTARSGVGGDVTRLGAWVRADEGLPAGARLVSVAHLDGHLFGIFDVAGATSLYARPLEAGPWRLFEPADRTPGASLRTVIVLDRALYLTTGDEAAGTGALYRLRYSDEPWERITTAPALPLSALHRRSGQFMLAASGANAGLYVSSDEGVTWTRRAQTEGGAAFLAHPVRALIGSPAAQRLFAVGDASRGFGGLFASDDLGATWTPAALRGDVVGISASDAFVLASTTLEAEQRSDNYGSTFRSMQAGTACHAFHVSGTRALAASRGGILVSDDAGETWREASEGLPSFVELTAVYLAGKTAVAAGPSGLFLSRLQ